MGRKLRLHASEIELFHFLTEISFEDVSFDLHNDFTCNRIDFEKGNQTLVLPFAKDDGSTQLHLTFFDVEIEMMTLPITDSTDNSILDSLYRGRAMVNKNLIEMKGDLGYFYLEFVGEQKLEFFSSGLELRSTTN